MAKKYPTLQISALSNTPYLVFGPGQKLDITHEFQQTMMVWICDGTLPGVGKTKTKELRADGQVHFEISLTQLVEENSL